ncbi:hypothetical protein R1sor_007941 [Riccia sorocarpa]|uniref:Uncharacterized protein n=1 Tax=Riccia sorocarpa TaxID=122646 RepID=A0ABD3HRY0_9MARC
MLTLDSLVKKIKTKHSVTAPWFVTQNVVDASLLLWRFSGDDVVPLGVILKTIAHSAQTIEFLSRKKEGGFYRYELQTKYMERKQSELALGAGLVSAPSNQLYRLFDKVMQSNQNYKILERESIKEALTAGFFGVMAKEPSHYLPHPECAKKSQKNVVVEAEVGGGDDDIDDEEFVEDYGRRKGTKKIDGMQLRSPTRIRVKLWIPPSLEERVSLHPRLQRRNFSDPASLLRRQG